MAFNESNNTVTAEDGWFSKPNPELEKIALAYFRIHPYTSLAVCTFGIITNIFNIITLTRKHMRTSINCILTGIAVLDICTMVSYIPFVVHFYLKHGLARTPEKYTYAWTHFLVFHGNLTSTTHTASIWLAVFLGILRFQCLQSAQGKALGQRRTIAYVGLISALSALLMVPNYVLMKVIPIHVKNSSQVIWSLENLGVGSTNPDPFAVALFWIYAIIGKILPCGVITVFGGLLLHTLHLSKKRTENLHSGSFQTRLKQHSRTTRMLLAVIVLFLVTELPQGVLVVLSGSVDGFFLNVYLLLGDMLDIIALLNNSINFVLYCTMSQQFRDTFVNLFKLPFGKKKPPRNQTEFTKLTNC